MSLFKRLLLSLFPDSFGGTSGPASMFLGLVNAKHFFTVISKRMVENPKLNLFDIGLDPVEVKIGFGEQATIKPKDIELYFSYCVCANINGYKFYNPTNIASLVSIALSQYFSSYFPKNKKGTDMFMVLLLTMNIMSYVFASRIKVFPEKLSKKELFQRFVDLFFNYYKFIGGVYNLKFGKKTLQELKAKLLSHTDIFFGLFYLYKRINGLFEDGSIEPVEYFERLFMDELKKNKTKKEFAAFQQDWQLYMHSSELSPMEDALLDALMPAEVLIKLFYNREDVFLMSQQIVPKLFPSEMMDSYLHSFLNDDARLEEWIVYIMDHKRRKESFFDNLKKTVMVKFHGSDGADLQDLLSSINDGDGGMMHIPESLKQEGMLMDRVLNFYVGLMGSMRIGRGDSFFIRLFRPGLITSVLSNVGTAKRLSINYYSSLLHQYSKNQFFYRVIFDGVRSGKSSFILPYVADIKEVYNNIAVLKHIDDMAAAVVLQDILIKDIKLSLHQNNVLSSFQQHFGDRVSSRIGFNTNTLLEIAYKPLDELLSDPIVASSLIRFTQDQDIKNLKDGLYTLDFRLYYELLKKLPVLKLSSRYTDSVIINIAALCKETLPGILFLLHTLLQKQQDKKTDMRIHQLLSLYITDILNLLPDDVEPLIEIIYELHTSYGELLQVWCKIDDNQYFLDVGADCWSVYLNQEKGSEHHISAEDVLRFRGYLKHVTYYNKRYVMPKL